MDFFNLSICVPVFNEAAIIAQTIIELKTSFPGAEIIVVDDGSTDQSLSIMRQIQDIVVLSHARNIGYGGALKSAMRKASRRVIAWYDSDGQHTPEDLKNVVMPVLNDEKEAVIGVRSKDSDVRLDRLPGKVLLTIIAEMVVRETIPDLNSGLRCFRKDVIKKYLHLLPDGFSASTTSTLLMLKRGYRLGYVTITTNQRVGVSTVKMFRDGWRTITVILRILILFDAFNFFTGLASLQIVPGMIYGLFIAFTRKLGFPTLASTIVISGILTFFMGIICDQIVAMRKEKFEDM